MATQQLIITDFSGGINTKVAPHLIQDSQCVDMESVDTEVGIIQAVKGNRLTASPSGGTPTDFAATLESSSMGGYTIQEVFLANSFTFFKKTNTLYSISSDSRLSGGKVRLDYYPMGDSLHTTYDLTCPSNSNLDVTGYRHWPAASGAVVPYTIQYAVTNYDSDRGSESSPAFTEATVTAEMLILGGYTGKVADDTGSDATGTGVVLRTARNTGDTTTDIHKFYRLGKLLYNGVELTEYRYIGEMKVGPEGEFTYFLDGTSSENAGEILATQNLDPYFNINASYKCIAEWGGRLFVSHVFLHTLLYSGGGSLNSFETNTYLDMPGVINGMASTLNGLYIICEDGSMFILTGKSPVDFVLTKIGYGNCIHPATMISCGSYVMWLSTYGIMRVSGYTVENLSKDIFTDIPEPDYTSTQWDKPVATIVDNIYYFMLGDGYVYRYDMSQRSLGKNKVPGLTHLHPSRGGLLGTVNKTNYSLFDTTPTEPWSYTSKEYSGQSYDSEIEYQSVKIAYVGQVTIVTCIDGVEILSVTTDQSATRTTDKFLLPEADNTGLTIQFKISGDATSKVYSLRSIYSYTNLEN